MDAKRKVAIFDIDGTLFRSSLFLELITALVDEGVFPKTMPEEYEDEYQRWQERKGTYTEFIEAIIDSWHEHIKGIKYADMEYASKIVLGRQKNHVYRYTRDLAKDLKKKGYYLLAISQSPRVIVEPFAKSWGFNKVYARFYITGPDDRLTGETEDLHLIANKANIVKRAVEKEKLSLKGSVGVGDSEGDISFLELVEKPICFNPSSALYKHAKRNGWRVVVERKDMIYQL